MYEIHWIQNGAVCSFRTHDRKEALDVQASASKYYVVTSVTLTDSFL